MCRLLKLLAMMSALFAALGGPAASARAQTPSVAQSVQAIGAVAAVITAQQPITARPAHRLPPLARQAKAASALPVMRAALRHRPEVRRE